MAAAAAVVACGAAAPAGTPTTAVAVGQSVGYRLYTHCGVRSADFNGTRYFAQPPLGDGSGNPPPGWGNPYDEGTLSLVDQHMVVFRDPAGHSARFTDAPAGSAPSVPACS